MKRDPVLAQLDFLINGPPKTPRAEEPPQLPPPPPVQPPPPLLAPNPVLAQLDALINGAPAAVAAEAEAEEPRGPPGILREFGGVKGWMARHGNPMCTTPTSVDLCQEEDVTSDVCKNMPLSDQNSCFGSR